ncbi:hypothetical protein JCM3774_003532 [Rhodotorula dairenensis]
MPALARRQLAPTSTTALADSAATRFIPLLSASDSPTDTANQSSYQSVLDVWQYVILVVVVLGAAALASTVCIFRRSRRIARKRREEARLATTREPDGETLHGLDDAVSLSDMHPNGAAELPPPAYRARPRSPAVSSVVTSETTGTGTGTVSDSRPSTAGTRSRPSLSDRLSRFPSALGAFLNKRVQPNLGGTSVSTDELQTRAAEAQLDAARGRLPSRRNSTSSSVFAFSPRRASAGGEGGGEDALPTAPRRSRLESDPPSAETLEQVRHIRRALSDAGLLFAAPPRSLSGHRLSGVSALGENRPAVLATMHEGLRDRDRAAEEQEEDAEREMARQERRARRRRRRERERQRREDEAGLPTYSREVAEGEAVLERAAGWKSEEDDEDPEEDDNEGSRHGREGPEGAVGLAGNGQELAASVPDLPPDPAAFSHMR